VAARAGVQPVVATKLPDGVTVQRRVSDDAEYVFFFNANAANAEVETEEWGTIRLAPYDVAWFTRDHRYKCGETISHEKSECLT